MMRWMLSGACALLLCGCTPSFQQKLQKEQVDEGTYDSQARQHAAAERCSDLIPGSTEHVACMLRASKAKP